MSRNKLYMRALGALGLIAALFAPLAAPVVLAHGRTNVGDYELVIGFHNEPAYQGEPNGLDLFVTNTKTKELVNDLADSLKVEILYGSSKRELSIRPQFGREGAYTADVLPTEAGDYTWHIWGDIEGTPVDISMSSSPDTFSPVRAKSEVDFPSVSPTLAELQAQTEAATRSAQTALIVGFVGAALGVIGIGVGFISLRAKEGLTTEDGSEIGFLSATRFLEQIPIGLMASFNYRRKHPERKRVLFAL